VIAGTDGISEGRCQERKRRKPAHFLRLVDVLCWRTGTGIVEMKSEDRATRLRLVLMNLCGERTAEEELEDGEGYEVADSLIARSKSEWGQYLLVIWELLLLKDCQNLSKH
jgi:hypothetical protein